MKHNEKIVFTEEGDQHPDTTPGDVVVILKKKKHPLFTRTPDGCHLILEKKLTLVEALTEFTFNVPHLDGRVLHVTSRPNTVYKTDMVQAIRNEGMPLRGDVFTRGHLYIKVEVVYPTTVTPAQKQMLQQILGGQQSPQPMLTTDADLSQAEAVTLVQVDLEAEKARYAQMLRDNPNQYDEDDDEGPREIGCRSS